MKQVFVFFMFLAGLLSGCAQEPGQPARFSTVSPQDTESIRDSNGSSETSISDATNPLFGNDAESSWDGAPKSEKNPSGSDTGILEKEVSQEKTRVGENNFPVEFEHPTSWEVKVKKEELVKLKKSSPESKNLATVTTEFVKFPGGLFLSWFGQFPKGTDSYFYNGKEYKFVAQDTEGPYSRTFYKAFPPSGAVKFEFFYSPAQTGSLGKENSPGEWNVDEAFSKKSFEEFVHMIDTAEKVSP